MKKIIKKTKKLTEFVNWIIIALPTLFTVIVSQINKFTFTLEKFLNSILITKIIIIISGLIVSNFLFLIIIYFKFIKSKKDNKLPGFGVYWDCNGTAYCPVCDKLLSKTSSPVVLECPDYKGCNFSIELRDDNNKQINVRDATAEMIERFINR